jgi:hypothetical protein
MLESLREEGMCFGCGSRNSIGLKLIFEQDGEVTRTTFVGAPEHQGWKGVIHGGLLATLLDEAMGQWLWARKIVTMTAEMTTRYRTATPAMEPERPALLPDCRTTAAIRASARRTCRTIKIIFTTSTNSPPRHGCAEAIIPQDY